MPFRIACRVCVAVAVVAAVGCAPKPTLPTVGSAAPKLAAAGPAVSEAEAVAFGRAVEQAFATADAAALDALLRIEDLFIRSVSDFNLTADEQAEARRGLRQSGGGERMCRSLISQLGDGAVTLLRTRVKDGRQTALFRVFSEQNGLNYLEFQIARGPDGKPVTEDVYIVLVGETLTQLVRRMMVAIIPAKKGGGGQFQLYQDNMPTIRRMNELVAAGDVAGAKRQYQSLPAALRDQKNVHILGLRALQGDDPAYLAELERYRKRYPNDPSLDLILVDYHVLKKDAKALRECLWRLDDAVGGDPILRVIDANFQLDQGDRTEARRLAEEAIKLEPDMIGAHWVLVAVALAEKDHKETARLLKRVVQACRFDLDAPGLKKLDDYKHFVASPEYAELCDWVAERAK